MTAIEEVRGARAFLRDHRRAERCLGRALLAECRAVARLGQALENATADTQRGLARDDVVDFELALGIVRAQLGLEPKAALGNRAEPAPAAIADLEHLVEQRPRGRVALSADDPRVLDL